MYSNFVAYISVSNLTGASTLPFNVNVSVGLYSADTFDLSVNLSCDDFCKALKQFTYLNTFNFKLAFADIYAGVVNPSLVLVPKVSVSYKPVDTLKVSGSVEVPIKFGLNKLEDFGSKA